jgi:hypothetical protein
VTCAFTCAGKKFKFCTAAERAGCRTCYFCRVTAKYGPGRVMLEAIPAEEVDVSNRSARAAVVLFV